MTAINATTGRPMTQSVRPQGGGASSAPTLDPLRIFRQYKWVLAIALAVGVVAGVGAHLVLRRTMPSFRSVVIYQLEGPALNISPLDSGAVDRDEFDRFSATQARVVTSDIVLTRMVNSREFQNDSEFGRQFQRPGGFDTLGAMQGLQEAGGGRPIPGTRFLELSMSARSGEDAQRLARLVDLAYFRYLDDFDGARVQRGIQPIVDQIISLERSVRSNTDEQQKILREQKMESSSDINAVARQRVAELSRKLDDNRNFQASTQVTLRTFEDDSRKEGGPTFNEQQRDLAERDPQVAALRTRVTDLRAEDAALAAMGRGENHQARRQLQERLRAIEGELEKARQETLLRVFNDDLGRSRRAVDQLAAEETSLRAQLAEAEKRATDVTAAVARLDTLRFEREATQKRIDELRAEERNARTVIARTARGEIDNIEINRLEVAQRGRVVIVQQASRPDSPTFPRIQIMVPVAVLLVLGLTVAGIVAREVLDTRVRGAGDVALGGRGRVLGAVPLASEDPMKPASVETAFRDSPTGAVSEGYRQVRAVLAKHMLQRGFKSLLVVPAAPESGATSAVCNLAMGFAASEQQVLVIDANFRRPALHRVFKLGEGPGLGEVLARQKTLEQAVQATSVANIALLSAGSSSFRAVPERLATEAMTQLIEQASKKYDIVIVDAAPAMIAGDAVALANRCDASVMIVRAMSDKRGMVSRIAGQLGDSKAEFLGVLINAQRSSAGGYMRRNIKAAFDYQNAQAS